MVPFVQLDVTLKWSETVAAVRLSTVPFVIGGWGHNSVVGALTCDTIDGPDDTLSCCFPMLT